MRHCSNLAGEAQVGQARMTVSYHAGVVAIVRAEPEVEAMALTQYDLQTDYPIREEGAECYRMRESDVHTREAAALEVLSMSVGEAQMKWVTENSSAADWAEQTQVGAGAATEGRTNWEGGFEGTKTQGEWKQSEGTRRPVVWKPSTKT